MWVPAKERFEAPDFKSTDRYATRHDFPSGRGRAGKKLCVWCGTELKGRQQRWCGNKACWDDAGIRMGQGIQSALMKRDKGICACCGLDTVALEKLIREAGRRVSGVGKWRGPYRNASMLLVRFGLTVHEAGKSLWEADHIVPVEEGGGCCGLDNFATLCIWCHKEKTKEQAAARAERNRKKKIVEGNQGNLFD